VQSAVLQAETSIHLSLNLSEQIRIVEWVLNDAGILEKIVLNL